MGWFVITKAAKVQTDDRNINQLQANLSQQLDQIAMNPIVDGLVIKSASYLSASNPTEINHGLGRALIGWIVVGNSAQSYAWDSQASNKTSNGHAGIDKTLLINVSANTTLTLYVF